MGEPVALTRHCRVPRANAPRASLGRPAGPDDPKPELPRYGWQRIVLGKSQVAFAVRIRSTTPQRPYRRVLVRHARSVTGP